MSGEINLKIYTLKIKILRKSFVCFFMLTARFLFAQQEGLISKIEDPASYFQDDRQTWVGRTIYFLNAKTVQIKNPYFDWYYDPFNMTGSKPEPEELMYKCGKIVEVWIGNLHVNKPDKDYVRMGFFWKVKLLHNDRTIYYWDDNESGISNFGFVDDYEEARSHVGEVYWNKSRDNLYRMDDSGGIPLKNLEKITLEEVRWGEFGSFPIMFIITTLSGERGYFLERSYSGFIKEWYTSDPREKYPDWSYYDWKFIENRRLHGKMNQDMVRISWGDPTKIENSFNGKGQRIQIWTYEGVKETTYYVRFLKDRLQHVWWDEKKNNGDSLFRNGTSNKKH